MKIAVLGGAGAMGSLYGGRLAEAGHDVTLIDVWQEGVEALNANGLEITDMAGEKHQIDVKASTDPAEVGPVDLILVFVKGYSTEEAVRDAAPMMGDDTIVLTLQNGPSNVPRIVGIVGEKRVLAGVSVNSSTTLGPGRIHHAGQGVTYIGELNGEMTERLERVCETFRSTGFEIIATDDVVKISWGKLALNAVCLAPVALLGFLSGEMLDYDGTNKLMHGILRELIAVAEAEGTTLDYDEEWENISGVLDRARKVKASMLQDVENKRKTEIDTINGAVVDVGKKHGIPTPYNESMFWLVKSLEQSFDKEETQ